jgi:hydrogenase maturation protein HypF
MPFAIMVRSTEVAHQLCVVSPQELSLLESRQRPIVLLRRRHGMGSKVCDAVAPRNPYLGIMLPYTPTHHLLMELAGDLPLVMTSGNRSHEPIAYSDGDALQRLGPIADVILRHNRAIHVRCDDSVTRVVAGGELPVRRSRGYAPQPLKLPIACPVPMLAVGGQFKGVFALGNHSQAFLSHHIGDLDQLEAALQFERDIALYEEMFAIRPKVIVHDLHPEYLSTIYAAERSDRGDMLRIGVQHHHAHMASCMAENGLNEPVIGVTFDGTGYGVDTTLGEPTIWGGEFLTGDYEQFERAAHFRNVALPGGDKAVREPWRMAAAHLLDALGDASLLRDRISATALRIAQRMISQQLNAPLTSSVGRLFDAVASIAGVRDFVTYEGQAAVELEWLAIDVPTDREYPFEVVSARDTAESPLVIDTRPMIRAIVKDVESRTSSARIARRFHSTLVSIIAHTCQHLRDTSGLNAVVLSGGVFMNTILATEVFARLTACGFRVYRHHRVPPNDGGLCLGQLSVGAARLQTRIATSQKLQSAATLTIPESRNPLTTMEQGKTTCASAFQAGLRIRTKKTTS